MTDFDSDFDLDEEFLDLREDPSAGDTVGAGRTIDRSDGAEDEGTVENFDTELLYCIQGLGKQDEHGVFIAADSVVGALVFFRFLLPRDGFRMKG